MSAVSYCCDEQWVEKYRPKSLADIVGHPMQVRILRSLLARKEFTHLLLKGSPGTGKTSLSLVLARELFGEHWRRSTLELNASDERGIAMVQDKVKRFVSCQQLFPCVGTSSLKSSLPNSKKVDGTAISKNIPIKFYPAPFKLVILDEADAITSVAQQALRRLMEDYVPQAYFILTCNNPGKLIAPIQSRCMPLYFSRMDPVAVHQRLMHIALKEGLGLVQQTLVNPNRANEHCINNTNTNASNTSRLQAELKQQEAATNTAETLEQVIDTLVQACPNDLRRTINVLQQCALSQMPMSSALIRQCLGVPLAKDFKQMYQKYFAPKPVVVTITSSTTSSIGITINTTNYSLLQELTAELTDYMKENNLSLQDLCQGWYECILQLWTSPGSKASNSSSSSHTIHKDTKQQQSPLIKPKKLQFAIETLADIEWRAVRETTVQLQLMALVSSLCLIFDK
jgi:DNA polymerase III delta prime subunit